MIDIIHNGKASGSVAQRLLNNGMNQNVLRPYSLPTGNLDRHDRPEYAGTYITENRGGKQVPVLISNETTLLRKDDWLFIDKVAVEAAQPRLNLINQLRARNLSYAIPNGFGKTSIETTVISDVNDAEISMNGVRESRNDRPEFDIAHLPLPIIHKDFNFYLREIEASRNGGSPLDTTMISLSARKVAELSEKLALGTYGSYQFGGGTVYGLTNWPSRITRTITSPVAGGWTPHTTLHDVGLMKQDSHDANHYGPWVLFTAPNWDTFLDEDYSSAKGDNTLRERLLKIRGLVGIETLDYLTGYQMVLVELNQDVIRIISGMELTTLQWEIHGGMQIMFKLMTIQVPQLRGDFNGNTGIVHGNV